MKSYQQLATEYNVHFQTVRIWVKKAGIKPGFLQPSNSGKRGGLLTILDESQQKQLQDWLDKRANEVQKTA